MMHNSYTITRESNHKIAPINLNTGERRFGLNLKHEDVSFLLKRELTTDLGNGLFLTAFCPYFRHL